MKNILKYFIIFILIFITLEFFTYNILKYKQIALVQLTDFSLPSNYKYSWKYSYFQNIFNNSFFREPVFFGEKHKILVFGCSYAYGADLEPEQTFSYKLAKQTSSTVYNRSYPGWTNSYMLYQIDNEKTNFNLKNIPQDIDNIIYIYMEDHINRLKYFYWAGFFENIYNLRYEKKRVGKDFKLKEYKPLIPFLHVFFITKIYHNFMENKFPAKNNEKNIELFLNIFDESHKKLKKLYPNAKFIVLEYNTKELQVYKKQLKQFGWELYSTFDILDKNINLNDDKYHFKNDCHPSEAAWDIIVKNFIEKNILGNIRQNVVKRNG